MPASGSLGPSKLTRPQPKSIGIPAITDQNVQQQNPHISKNDVEAYVKVHPFHGGPAVAGVVPKVTTIDYITSKEASQRLKGESIGLADQAMVYYVEWQGPFNPVSASVPYGTPPLKPVDKGVEIFFVRFDSLRLFY